MEAKQLRLGNLFLRNNEIWKVFQLEHRYKNVYRINDVDVNFDNPTEIEENCKGVFITEDKLLELGFAKTYNEEDTFDYYLTVGRKAFILSLADYGDNDFHVLYRCDIGIKFYSLTYIDYIHQIQNIVFDLTETELTIKQLWKK
jgi:hypothetical protein